MIARHALREPTIISRVIAGQFVNNRHNPARPISSRTVRNRLRDVGLRSWRPMRVPLLTPTHQRQRLAYARRYVHWSQQQWTNVLFTDESRFCLHGNDRRVRVWRRRGERYNANHTRPVTAFSGGSVMVWAGVSRYSRTPLIVLPPGGLTAERYVDEILRPVLLPLRQRMGNRFVLMQDNARAHTARHTLRFLRQNRISVLHHPAVSPDLNPIEHVWDILGRRLRRQYPNLANLRQLADALRQIWNRIPQVKIRKCINMCNRLREVIVRRGGNTHY